MKVRKLKRSDFRPGAGHGDADYGDWRAYVSVLRLLGKAGVDEAVIREVASILGERVNVTLLEEDTETPKS